MTLNRNHFIAAPQREALISLTALCYIEEHELLSRTQFDDAKKSLQALFLRASGEETMLRQLIELLKSTRNIHRSFASIAGILGGAGKCAATITEKFSAFRIDTERLSLSAEENAAFVGVFLSYSQQFVNRITTFVRMLEDYLELKEDEARAHSHYRIALDARGRLKQRLAGGIGAEPGGEVETRIRDEIVNAFDYGEAEDSLKTAVHESHRKEQEIQDGLIEIKAMCRMAMNPDMREGAEPLTARGRYDDVYARFGQALSAYPHLETLRPPVQELFRLYQHAYGMFMLDFTKLNQAIDTMLHHTDAYFEAKEEDRDIALKRDKLRKIEGLIPFLEHSVRLALEEEMDMYYKFSRQLSAVISGRKTQWLHIAEDLLRAKIQAEAEISTRL